MRFFSIRNFFTGSLGMTLLVLVVTAVLGQGPSSPVFFQAVNETTRATVVIPAGPAAVSVVATEAPALAYVAAKAALGGLAAATADTAASQSVAAPAYVVAQAAPSSPAPASTDKAPPVEAQPAPVPAPPPAVPAVPPAVAAPAPVPEPAAPQTVPAGGQTPPSPGTTAVGTAEDRVELHVKDADLSAELRLLGEQHKLNIIAGKDLAGKVTADLYDVTIDEALHAVLEMNGFAYRRVNNFIYVYTKQQLKDIELAEKKPLTKTFTLNYINVDDATSLIKPALSKSSIVAGTTRAKAGIPSGSDAVGGDDYGLQDRLVVTDFEENLKEVATILTTCDVRPKEVLVEATILQVTLNDTTTLGVDFNALAGIDFHQITTATDPLVKNPNGIVAGATAPASKLPWGTIGTNGFATPGVGFQVGVITNDVSLFIQALETVQDVNVLSNPKVLALNKQRAEVLVGDRIGYKTTTATASSNVETINFLDTGTQLQFRPYISEDGYIRMEVHPKVSSGSVDATSGIPSERTTEVTCNIMVRDGHTVVIGGLFDENTSISKSRIPGLGNVPVVGGLFGNSSHATLRREIIVLLTPHVIEHAKAEVEGQEMMKYVERTTMSLRNRFPIYTREKLTQLFLGEAEKSYSRYAVSHSEKDRAATEWNLWQARHVAPNSREANELLEKVQVNAGPRQPRLENENVLWKRMAEQGLVNEAPAAPTTK